VTHPLVRAEGLTKTFVKDGTPIEVLRSIDLEIRRGETLAITGRSGAGKSTLLQILGTLDRPSAGRVVLDGHDVFGFPEARLAAFRGSFVGFVFQFHHLLPELTTLENASMPALIARRPRSEASARAESMLQRVGLGHRLTHLPSELSGGEQQRVALARALVMEPPLVLADEPTGNLDDATGTQILELLDGLVREKGVAVVVVTHHTGLANSMHRRLHMAGGRIEPWVDHPREVPA
jgi:lipoprotein-releasing system ATP-binding protein